jgi:hypothetical protein
MLLAHPTRPTARPLAAAPPCQPKQRVKPPVPARYELPVMGLTSDRNYITSNAVGAILSKPKPQVRGVARSCVRSTAAHAP